MHGTEELQDYLESVARIDPLNLNDEFVRLPSDLAYCNARYADALRDHLLAKLKLAQVVAHLRILKRETLGRTNNKVTESMVDSAVETSEEYITVYTTHVELEIEMVRWKGYAEALRAKKDALISLGAQVRAEMSGDPRIAEQHGFAHGHSK